MKLLSIVGARPQFIKLAVISRAIADYNQAAGASGDSLLQDLVVHTGQHFDREMSQVFFEELGIAQPAYNLGIDSLNHGAMTGRMILAIEELLQAEAPDWVLVYGDTNSTLAGAIAAAKLNIPLAHVEAGVRSFNRRMPEEINRVLTDHAADLLFCPTATAMENLAAEGIAPAPGHWEGADAAPIAADGRLKITRGKALAVNVGDVMFDAARYQADLAQTHADSLRDLGLNHGRYLLTTVHRQENTSDPKKLGSIFNGLARLSRDLTVVAPLHPRTRACLERSGMLQSMAERLMIIEPVSYGRMAALLRGSRLVLTDSGGVQREAFFNQVPCITLRQETEWVELLGAGNRLAPADEEEIVKAAQEMMASGMDVSWQAGRFGDGNAGSKIVDILARARVVED